MNKTKISAKVVADSLDSRGNRLTSLLITFPRIILAEINTHRMLSKNTSSSRAIPFLKMVEAVKNDPFIPIAWQKEHTGMQGYEYFTDSEMTLPDGDKFQENYWLIARDKAVEQAKYLHEAKVTKQLCNRLLEPFMWTTMLITGSKEGWENFHSLRCPDYVFHDENKEYHFKSKKDVIQKFGESEWVEGEYNKPLKDLTDIDWLKLNKGQAEIHIMDLAEKIYDAVNESTPRQLQSEDWHIPFEDKIHIDGLQGIEFTLKDGSTEYKEVRWITESKVKISTAMAAHTSYTIVGGEAVKSPEKWIELHDKLIAYDPPHSSPMEHCARAMSNEEYVSFIKGNLDAEIDADGYIDISTHINNHNSFGWCRNFKGFIPYRHIIETKKYGNI